MAKIDPCIVQLRGIAALQVRIAALNMEIVNWKDDGLKTDLLERSVKVLEQQLVAANIAYRKCEAQNKP